jgi:hypothetical protein
VDFFFYLQEKLGPEYGLPAAKKSTTASSKSNGKAAAATVPTPAVVIKLPSAKDRDANWPIKPRLVTKLPADMAPLKKSDLRALMKDIAACEYAGPFLAPVDFNEAPGYEELIQEPMDIGRFYYHILCCA